MTISTPCYTTREEVKAALDFAETARNNTQIDRAIETGSRTVEGLCHRRFYPETGTRYFDWPDRGQGTPWRLWLDSNELISVSALVAGGVTIGAADYFLRRSDGLEEPPYTHLEIDLSSASAFTTGSTRQRDIAITGVFGYSADEAPAGALAEDLDATETAVDVTDSAAAGVGTLLKVGTERMLVVGKTMLTTAQTLQTALTANKANTTVAVSTGSAYAVGETVLLDSERMLIEDVAGNNLTVKRAWDGSVLAAHTGSTIYAPRTLTVVRGALGTTAATHSNAAAIVKHQPPGPVRDLALAEALAQLLGEAAGYAAVVGAGSRDSATSSRRPAAGGGMDDVRGRVYTRYGRKARIRAV